MSRRAAIMFRKLHSNCRKTTAQAYIRDDEQTRCAVPDDKVLWSVMWPEYNPDDYTMAQVLRGPVWADPVRFEHN